MHTLGITLDACRAVRTSINKVTTSSLISATSDSKHVDHGFGADAPLLSGWSKVQKIATQQESKLPNVIIADLFDEAIKSMLKYIARLLVELSSRRDLLIFGGLNLRLKQLAASTREWASNPLVVDLKDVGSHIRRCIWLLEWPQSRLCEVGLELSPPLMAFVQHCKTKLGYGFSRTQYNRILPHELIPQLKGKEKKGGGFFGFGGASAGDGEADSTEIGFVHGVESVHHDSRVIDVVQAARQVAAPPAVQREAVLLHYLVDTHYDTVVAMLIEHQAATVPLSPNPFFDALYHTRAAMWMVECYDTTDRSIHNALMGNVDKIADADYHRITSMHGGGVYMYSVGSAFIGVDTEKVGSVLKKVFWLINENISNETATGELCSVHAAAVGVDY